METGKEAGTGIASDGKSSAVKGGKTVEECQGMIQKSLRTPMVKFLREHMEKAGCGVGEKFFKAIHCDQSVGGGYVPGEGVVVCSNHMNIQDEVNQVVIHALIHAYDDCRANIDWTDCAHLACSKIRANHLSGDCHYKREFLRGNLKIRGHEQECVKRRVIKELTPHFSETAARDAMEAVWETCYNDTKPFDRAP
ncbi:mitochondrial inner membrane protease ATP23 homolog [Ipomoea triloba]|uniref:mitochondrial inner membrane protease ATP23 homolog n=1 Tax=Ipomoea nil TaxID=35883 RepID=UPI000900C096|nr:PREDICTED: mitochondrial inner membrane protease ATP23 homolog [Ipomoea nil]XP_031117669.1 mitochondrial inner membrane protease ATP23 homolog [Ipomoea triloba]